jgi:hypothetical protein
VINAIQFSLLQTAMKFELLTNEILLDLFEFLDAVDLLRAFSDINTRFDSLLFTNFHAYQLDFQLISSSQIDFIESFISNSFLASRTSMVCSM